MATRQELELPNVGPGPNPLSLTALGEDNDFVLLLFQRDHYCTNCRGQVQDVRDHYEKFRARDAEVVSIVPEPVEKVREWQDSYDLPYPLCADPDTTVSSAYDQPVRFGPLGKLSDFFGRMPKVVLLDFRGDEATVAYTHEGSSTWDRPEIEDLLDTIDELR